MHTMVPFAFPDHADIRERVRSLRLRSGRERERERSEEENSYESCFDTSINSETKKTHRIELAKHAIGPSDISSSSSSYHILYFI